MLACFSRKESIRIPKYCLTVVDKAVVMLGVENRAKPKEISEYLVNKGKEKN